MDLDLLPDHDFLIKLVQTFYDKFKHELVLRKCHSEDNKIGLELYALKAEATAAFRDPEDMLAVLKMLLEKTSLIKSQRDILEKYINIDDDIIVSKTNADKSRPT